MRVFDSGNEGTQILPLISHLNIYLSCVDGNGQCLVGEFLCGVVGGGRHRLRWIVTFAFSLFASHGIWLPWLAWVVGFLALYP